MKAKKEEKEEYSLDMEAIQEQTVKIPVVYDEPKEEYIKENRAQFNESELINCLRDEVVEVRFVPQPNSITDPKHVMYGGMSENSRVTICVPKLRSGIYVDVLTKSEKDYLEYVLGLRKGAMNVYNKVDNFWNANVEGSISKVILNKRDNRLNLADPYQYIQYKILLANKDIIAPDLRTLQDKPKATYKFVLIADEDINTEARIKMSTKKQCYMEFGKIENDPEVMKAIIEIMTSKPVAENTKIEFLQTKIGELIDVDSKAFLAISRDPLLPTKILIKKCIEQGFISKRGDFLYLRADNSPLCEGNEDPTMSVAAKYLSNPKRQQIKLSLEAQLKN